MAGIWGGWITGVDILVEFRTLIENYFVLRGKLRKCRPPSLSDPHNVSSFGISKEKRTQSKKKGEVLSL